MTDLPAPSRGVEVFLAEVDVKALLRVHLHSSVDRVASASALRPGSARCHSSDRPRILASVQPLRTTSGLLRHGAFLGSSSASSPFFSRSDVVVARWPVRDLSDPRWQVSEGELLTFDKNVVRALRNSANPSVPIGPWLQEAARNITSLGSTIVLGIISLAVVGYLFLARKPAEAWLMLGAVVGGIALNNLLKFAFARARPDFVSPATRIFKRQWPANRLQRSCLSLAPRNEPPCLYHRAAGGGICSCPCPGSAHDKLHGAPMGVSGRRVVPTPHAHNSMEVPAH
jgi:hypothetical protein